MNKNQRYYAILALTQNPDFIEDIKALRRAQSFLDQTIPEDGFESPEDVDAFIKAQNQAVQEKKIDVDEHPLWKLEQDIVSLMNNYGMPFEKNDQLLETMRHYIYLNDLLLYTVKTVHMSYDFLRHRDEITITINHETTRADLESSISPILAFRDEMLAQRDEKLTSQNIEVKKDKQKQRRRQPIPKFDRDLAFYKMFLEHRRDNPSFSTDRLILEVYKTIEDLPQEDNPDRFEPLFDKGNATKLIHTYERKFGALKLLHQKR